MDSPSSLIMLTPRSHSVPSEFSLDTDSTPLPGTTFLDLLDGYPELKSAISKPDEDCTSLVNQFSNGSPAFQWQLHHLFMMFSQHVQNLERNISSLQSRIDASKVEVQALHKLLKTTTQYKGGIGKANTQFNAAECPAKFQAGLDQIKTACNHLEQELREARAAQSTSRDATCRTSTPAVLGSDVPIFYEAERDPHKRQFSYSNWCSLIRLRLELDHAVFSTPATRILYTCSRLGAAAYARVRAHVDEVALHRFDCSRWPKGWTDYDSVFKSLDPYYMVVDVYAKAVQDFEKLQQGDACFANFMLDFLRHADDSRRSDAQRVEALMTKTNTRLRLALMHVPAAKCPGPENVSAWMNLLLKLSSDLEEVKQSSC
ncbi:hypothetical protein GGS21DRAFT_361497 [Xylaria nigripes]|nr:hypothetical protein GGS21DRAFT_361497 [Xylaria nigripes]